MVASAENAKRSLGDRVLSGAAATSDAILNGFLTWASEAGYALYPAQEEAVLELAAHKHVILNTPTGSGKSLVALAMHYQGLCEGARSFYTSPIKALVSEKFFALCRDLGADKVGMLTGDASINPKAPVICCTAEILANMALREGRYLKVDYVIMDEFHYYADPDRGVAWQIPLLLLNDATFLLMSATLGDVAPIAQDLKRRTDKDVAWIRSRERPVPLDYRYVESQLFRTLTELGREGKLPVYLVSFTQREATEEAQNITSIDLTSKEDKQAVTAAIRGFRFDTPFGKEMRRFVRQGIGVHHAGLLPKYRLLVEQLSQRGLLKVISGTDTLGVGVNIPIRTVLFTKLCKYDGTKVRVLSVREFQQLAGRAGRRGFDTQGSVVAEAPEHIIENKIIAEKQAQNPNKKLVKKKPPEKGFVHYDIETFKRLIDSEPEPLRSQFDVNHGMLMAFLSRELVHGERHSGYRRLIALIAACHDSDAQKKRHRRKAAQLFRSLRTVGVLSLTRPEWDPRLYVEVKPTLQKEFSLHHALSLYLVETLAKLEPTSPTYALDVLSLVEAILENPQVVLERQEDKAKGDKIAELKAAGVPYDERIAELENVSYPRPNADFFYATFDAFREVHPWVAADNVRPKSIARDMVERYLSFNDYVREYGLMRSEGVLLRYLSDAYKTLVQSVPSVYRTDELLDALAYLRTVLGHVDTSLIKEWERLLEEGGEEPATEGEAPRFDIVHDRKALLSRLRAEAHVLVKALSMKNWEDAAAAVWQPPDETDPERWTEERFAQVLAPYFAEHSTLVFNHAARLSEHTLIKESGVRQFSVVQRLIDPAGDNAWAITANVDLSDGASTDGPLLRLTQIGT